MSTILVGQEKLKSAVQNTSKTQKEAKATANAYMIDKAQGLNVDCAYPFSEWADIWYEGHKDNFSPTTQENYTYTLRILKEQFGNGCHL